MNFALQFFLLKDITFGCNLKKITCYCVQFSHTTKSSYFSDFLIFFLLKMGSVESNVCEIIPFSSQLTCISDNLLIVNYSNYVIQQYILNSIAPLNLSNEFEYIFSCGKDIHNKEGNIRCDPITKQIQISCGSKLCKFTCNPFNLWILIP